MSGFRIRTLACLFVLGAASLACKYDPHPKGGEQACYYGRCVDGYVCAFNGFCYPPADLPMPPGTGGVVTVPVGTGGKIGSGGIIGYGGVTVAGGVSGYGGVTGYGGVPVGSGGTTAGSGGSTGTGGATTCQPTRATGSLPLIDNMADGDLNILSQDGRSGGWYTYADNTGTVSLVSSNPGAMCAIGSGFTNWGAGLGVSLNSAGTQICTYDASIYSGVRFSIQGTITSGMVRLSVQTADIANTSAGGTCISTSTTTNNCDDVYGADLLPGATGGVDCASGTTSWTCGPVTSSSTGPLIVSIPFSYMSQQGWGRSFPIFDRTKILGLQWQFKTCTETGCYTSGTSFNMCVGNVTFF